MKLFGGKKDVRRPTDSHRTAFFNLDDFWRRAISWIFVFVALVISLFVIFYVYRSYNDETCFQSVPIDDVLNEEDPSNQENGLLPNNISRSSVDGRVFNDDTHPEKLFAVVVDNISVARPQAAVNDATLVWEAPVEGGITRLLLLVRSGTNLKRIGPVRSVRPYFIDWAREYNAAVVHVGGSPQALSELQNTGWPEIDEMSRGGYFWRDRKRSAPHNAYTSSALLHEALDDGIVGELENEENSFRPFIKGEPVKIGTSQSGQEIRIVYGLPNTDLTWRFDKDAKKYLRFQGVGSFTDELNQQVDADNVIVQLTDISIIDSAGRRKIRTTGSGQAWIFSNGTVYEATWIKETNQRTKFVDSDSKKEIPLQVGTTWVEVIGNKDMLSFK